MIYTYKNCVIVNFANGHFAGQQDRLKYSLIEHGYSGDILLFNNENQLPGCPGHQNVPYSFKPYSIMEAVKKGYDYILWIDSPIVAIKPLDKIFEHIKTEGYCFFNNIGHELGKWTSDACLKKHSIGREESFNIKMIMACCMGFNMIHASSEDFINEYYKAATDGISYIGSWTNGANEVSTDKRVMGHRHDQSVASILIHKLNLNILTGNETFFMYDSHKLVMTTGNDVCLLSI